jgi:hypothetical protein
VNNPIMPRLGAACGAIFAVVLFVADGGGSHAFSAPRAVAGICAITLAVPFIAYVSSRLREAEGPNGWLSTTALVAGVAGITLKLASGAPALALHRAHVADGTRLHKALDEIAGGATLLSLYPLAVFCASVAIVSLRTRALPRWLGAGAAITAAALVANGALLGVSFLPALVLFLLWTLVASIHLVRGAGRADAVGSGAHAAAGA